MRIPIVTSLFVLLFFVFTPLSIAASSYVLPYPGVMPGSKFYKIHTVWDRVMQYWYFGNLSQFKYNLSESDKYLVEAKTLFEYQQYLLGYNALLQSDHYFSLVAPSLSHAQQEGKDIHEKRDILHQASLKHIEVLESLTLSLPQNFVWRPEKASASHLALHDALQRSIALRQKAL